MKGLCTPADADTTSELHERKCRAGCARYRVNEWREIATRVEPWNTELYPTPDLFRGGYFYIFPPTIKEVTIMSEENQFTFENPEYRKTYWHSCSHIMATDA